jgi:hypothetical protein
MAYRNSPSSRFTAPTYLFYAGLPVDPAKTLVSVTLPSGVDQGDEPRLGWSSSLGSLACTWVTWQPHWYCRTVTEVGPGPVTPAPPEASHQLGLAWRGGRT